MGPVSGKTDPTSGLTFPLWSFLRALPDLTSGSRWYREAVRSRRAAWTRIPDRWLGGQGSPHPVPVEPPGEGDDIISETQHPAGALSLFSLLTCAHLTCLPVLFGLCPTEDWHPLQDDLQGKGSTESCYILEKRKWVCVGIFEYIYVRSYLPI